MRKPLQHVLLDLDDVPLDGGECACCPRGGLCCPADPLDEVMECVLVSDDAFFDALRIGCSSLPLPQRRREEGGLVECAVEDVRPPPSPPPKHGESGHVKCGSDVRPPLSPPPPQREEPGHVKCGSDVLREEYGRAEESDDITAVEDACELDVSLNAPQASAATTPSSPENKPSPSLLYPAPPPLSPAEIETPPWPPSPAPLHPSPRLFPWTPRSRRGRRRRRPAHAVCRWHCPFPLYGGDEVHEDRDDRYNKCNELSSYVNGDRLCSRPPRRIFVPVPDRHFDIINYNEGSLDKISNGDGGTTGQSLAVAGSDGGKVRRISLPQKRNRQANRTCTHCLTSETPQWRAGPAGRGTLCNACGIRLNTHGDLLPEYRPSTSPSFRSDEHSNRQKRAMKMREEKEKARTVALPPGDGLCTYKLA